MATDTLPVSEIFPAWQGEGPHAGRRCTFVRLGHCNLSCEWCDTPYTWDDTRYPLDFPEMTARAIIACLPGDLTILSGGEPMIHQHRAPFLEIIEASDETHIETNGTIAPTARVGQAVRHFTVSPKINTTDPEKRRIRPPALEAFADLARKGRACFKIVACDREDVATAAALAERYRVPPDAMWIMPEGITGETVIAHARLLAPVVADHGFNLTLRQHVIMYDNERGR